MNAPLESAGERSAAVEPDPVVGNPADQPDMREAEPWHHALLSELAPLHPRNDTFPGEVFLHVAADAQARCGASRADPPPLEGLRERFLPECDFRGRQNGKLQYAVLAAAAIHGGTEPDLLEVCGPGRAPRVN